MVTIRQLALYLSNIKLQVLLFLNIFLCSSRVTHWGGTVCHFTRNIDNWNMMRRTLLLLRRHCNKCDITSLTSLPVNISILRNISDKKCTKPNFQYFSRKFKYQLTLALDHHTKCDHLHGYFLILFNVTFSGNISRECWVCYLLLPTKIGEYSWSPYRDTDRH